MVLDVGGRCNTYMVSLHDIMLFRQSALIDAVDFDRLIDLTCSSLTTTYIREASNIRHSNTRSYSS
jgi:hypothetical protein